MDLARYLVQAVLVEGRSAAEVAAAHGVSRSWVYELLARHRREGEAGLVARSKRPKRSSTQVPVELDDEIVEMRKALSEEGHDARPHTIHFQLGRRHPSVPSVPSLSSIWRILSRRGFGTPQPQKRPKSSFVRRRIRAIARPSFG